MERRGRGKSGSMGAGCFHVGVRALIEETAPQIEVVMDIDAHDVYARMRTMLSQDAGVGSVSGPAGT
jgi:hypothetical protein